MRFFWSVLICLISLAMRAQDSAEVHPWRNGSWLAAPHYGFIIPHTSSMTHLIQGHSFGGMFQYYRKGGVTAWEQLYGLPERAIDLNFINTGNVRQFGVQFTTSYWLGLPLIRYSKRQFADDDRFMHWLSLGLGVGYASKTWDFETNRQAPVLGSHINAALSVQYAARIFRAAQHEWRAGIRITHLSNGSFKTPNLGTNDGAVFIAFKWNGANADHRPIQRPMFKLQPHRFTIGISAGAKEIQPPLGRKYGTYTLQGLYERRVSAKSSLGLGVDVFYNSSIKPLMEQYDRDEVSNDQIPQLGLLFSYTLHFNAFELKMQQGVYAIDQWKNDGLFYHRFGLRYRVQTHWYAQLMLKTHFAKADYGELGVGYAF